ncbi:MAG TPA: glycosyltransferase [Planctomycetaceae bacterium]|nr:glycosyltransferase [Planctomycetaceae bacterium]
MRLLLCTAGTLGDVHPVLAIAVAMQQRGHCVTVITNPAYESACRAAGVDFAPVGSAKDIEEIRSDRRAWNYMNGWKIWLKRCGVVPMRELYAAIRERHVVGETVLAGSYLAMGARVAEEHLQIPAATLHFDSHTIRTSYAVHAMPFPTFFRGMPNWCFRVSYWIADHFYIDPIVLPELNPFRLELNLPPVTRVAQGWWHSPRSILGLFPDWFCSPKPDWPPNVQLTGFPFWDRSSHEPLSESLAEFLDHGSAPILFTPGASGMHTRRYFAAATEACRRLGRRGLIVTHHVDLLPSPLPKFMHVESYVPFSRIMPRIAVAVHHAGIGTSAQCLAAGVPQLVIPTLYNQPDTAGRLEALGLAKQLSPRRISAHRFEVLLRELLKPTGVAAECQRAAKRIEGVDSIGRVCEHLEQLLSGPRTVDELRAPVGSHRP